MFERRNRPRLRHAYDITRVRTFPQLFIAEKQKEEGNDNYNVNEGSNSAMLHHP